MIAAYATLAAAIMMGVTGQFLLKAGATVDSGGLVQQMMQPASILGLGAYGISALLYMWALRDIPLSVAYPSVSASYVLVVVTSALLFGETVSWTQVGGMALICAGVVLLYV